MNYRITRRWLLATALTALPFVSAQAAETTEKPEISTAPEAWHAVEFAEGTHTEPRSSEADIAAFNLLNFLQFIVEGEEYGDIHGQVVETTDDATKVVVTLVNVMDDEIQDIRYLVILEDSADAWTLKSIGRQLKRWPDRGGKGWEKG